MPSSACTTGIFVQAFFATENHRFCYTQLVESTAETVYNTHKGGMKNMKNHSSRSLLAQNLSLLRQRYKYSQEDVAEKLGVSRQAVAKWESGETLPDILNCGALAQLYDVNIDDLLHFDPSKEKMGIPPKGKHIFGVVKVGERGQIVLPKKARDIFRIQAGDMLVVLGDEEPEHPGIALMQEDYFLQAAHILKNALKIAEEETDGEGEKQ